MRKLVTSDEFTGPVGNAVWIHGCGVILDETTFSEKQKKAADVNADGATDAIDASSILGYYAYIATGGSGTIEEYLNS